MPSSVKRSISSSIVNSSSSRARRPAEQREEVDHPLGDVALPLVFHHRGRAVPLAQALLVGAHDERHVRELRRRRAERLVEQHLLRRVRDVIVAADDVRDRHVDVVDDDRQVIGRMAVGAEDDEALDVLVVELDRPVHEIGERRLSRGHLEADRALVVERVALRQQALGGGAVPARAAATGSTGACGPPTSGPSSQSRPSQRRPSRMPGDHLVRRALDVGVFDAQDEDAAVTPRVEPVEQRRAGAADVQVAGGRGGETKTRSGHTELKCIWNMPLRPRRPSVSQATTRTVTRGASPFARTPELLVPKLVVTSAETGHRYQVERFLGQGGFGQVYLATRIGRSAAIPSTVCIKVSARIDGWLREAYFGQLLDGHPRAIRVYDRFPLVRADGRVLYCLVLEYARHGDLSAFLLRARQGLDAKPIVRREIAGILEVLGKLHRGQMLHRDLTPLNVFVCDGGS